MKHKINYNYRGGQSEMSSLVNDSHCLLNLRVKHFSKKCRKWLLAGFITFPFLPTPVLAQAAQQNDSVSIETLEQEIQHIEQAQAALQRDLQAVRQQLAVKKQGTTQALAQNQNNGAEGIISNKSAVTASTATEKTVAQKTHEELARVTPPASSMVASLPDEGHSENKASVATLATADSLSEKHPTDNNTANTVPNTLDLIMNPFQNQTDKNGMASLAGMPSDQTPSSGNHSANGSLIIADDDIAKVRQSENGEVEVFKHTDVPTEAIIARHSRDIIAMSANNGVGPHPRESAGAQISGALGDHGIFNLGPMTFVLGGFIDASGVAADRHVASGTFNFWQAMPYRNNPDYHLNNMEASARYTRLSLLVRGNISQNSTISGFVETDFGAGGATTDPYESNSYVMRLRQAYLAYDNTRYNFHVLGGQAWSLATPNRVGIIPRQESVAETIESSMLAGQTWARQWQVRLAKDWFNHQFWAALSVENPATLYDTTGFTDSDGKIVLPNGSTSTITSTGTGLTQPSPYSSELAPDVIGKLAWDPAWGHYEIVGIMHMPHDRVTAADGTGHNYSSLTGGGGGSMVLPIVPKKVELRLAGMVGKGIGRYGSVLLPDATIDAEGRPVPIWSLQATAGIMGHVTPRIDLYGYYGIQEAGRAYFTANGIAYGYGNPLYDNSGCSKELSSACVGSTKRVSEATIGGWWRFLKGHYGTVQAGVQLAYSTREGWQGVGGSPTTHMSEFFFSLRYLPFQ